MKIKAPDRTLVVQIDPNYGLTFRENTKGWPGSGFKHGSEKLSFRRVKRNGRDELQINFSIIRVKGDANRMFESAGSIVIEAEHLPALLAAIQGEELPAPIEGGSGQESRD